MKKCDWCLIDPLYEQYHDEEWGVPVHDDRTHFEALSLEVMQAGLSWLTILKRREQLRKIFDQFEVEKVMHYDESDVERILNQPGAIRHRQKITSIIHNAKCFKTIQQEYGSFDQYIWQFVNNQTIVHSHNTLATIPSSSPLSDQITQDLKAKGFKFIGTTIIYAYLQAIGIIDDHLNTCFKKAKA